VAQANGIEAAKNLLRALRGLALQQLALARHGQVASAARLVMRDASTLRISAKALERCWAWAICAAGWPSVGFALFGAAGFQGIVEITHGKSCRENLQAKRKSMGAS
jgi:hypothetical protein